MTLPYAENPTLPVLSHTTCFYNSWLMGGEELAKTFPWILHWRRPKKVMQTEGLRFEGEKITQH